MHKKFTRHFIEKYIMFMYICISQKCGSLYITPKLFDELLLLECSEHAYDLNNVVKV